MNISGGDHLMRKNDLNSSGLQSSRPTHTRVLRIGFTLLTILLATVGVSSAQEVENGLLHVGGFRCASVKPLKNDSRLDLYSIGDWTHTGFRMEVWRKLGIPFWYRQNTGVVRVAGEGWHPDLGDDISSAEAGGKAAESQDDQEVGAGNANDTDKSTFWEPAGRKPRGTLTVSFATIARVNKIRFLSDNTPLHTPRDYSVGVVLPDGSQKEIASISGDYSIGGTWRGFAVPGVEAKGIYLSIRSSSDGKHTPVINELEAKGEFVSAPPAPQFPSRVVLPMGGYAGTALHFIGNVGSGFPATPDVQTPVGEYVVHYANGQTESIHLVAGKNVADVRYGHFVPEAQFAYGLKPHDLAPGETAYHLEQMLQVEAKSQFLIFSHQLEHPGWPVQSVEFRCTRPGTTLLLAAVTLQQSGPRISPLFYGGKMVMPYPEDAPPVPASPLGPIKDHSREIPLDGDWNYTTDPGNEGIRKEFFSPSYDASSWKTMAVPSQWYVKGLDYNGVVWFRREIQVPDSFGPVMELHFGGVDYEARVWVNGVYVGRHVGAYSHFKLNVSSTLRRRSSNLVVVRVDCPIEPGFEGEKTLIKGNSMDDIAMPYGEEGSMGGIFRSVFLGARGDVGIRDLWAATQLGEDLKHAEVTVKLDLENSVASGKVEVRATLAEPEHPEGQARSFTATTEIKLDSGMLPVELPISVDNPLLWYPWEQGTPYLHKLRVEILQNGEVLDQQSIQVGLRQVEFNDAEHYVLVNHHRIFLKGVLDDDIHWMSLMDRRGYAQRIQMQKDANLNIIRMVGHQSSPDMYDLCDEMGMMIWQEMPLQWGYSRTEAIRRQILEVVRETVEQTRPYTSVVGWSAWNEGGQAEFSDQITAMIRSLDGTRPLTRASGNGEFDVHIYPNMDDGLQRRTALWTGYALNFASETGSYGLSSEEAIKEMAGDDYFHFDSADPLWDNFDSYRWVDDPVFLDAPKPAAWPTEKIRQYVLAKIKPSERFYAQYHKFQYENARAQRFAPTTALIHCRFDDAYPLAYSGAPVNFTGRPKPAYFTMQNANRPVLPILFFDFEGAKDVRVVNDYWFRSWKNATLAYRLRTRDGKTVVNLKRTFDLPPDSTVPVLTREEAGDVWHVPGGFFADLTVADADGRLLSENHYDLTEWEVQTFVTSVYPLAPVRPTNAVIVAVEQATSARGVYKQLSEGGTYSHELLQTAPSGAKPQIEFWADVPESSAYFIRVSASSGRAAHQLDLFIDGKKAELETYTVLDANEHLTRDVYNPPAVSWYPGWHMRLSKGKHTLVFTVPNSRSTPELLLDAIALQSYKELTDPYVIPGVRDVKAEEDLADPATIN